MSSSSKTPCQSCAVNSSSTSQRCFEVDSDFFEKDDKIIISNILHDIEPIISLIVIYSILLQLSIFIKWINQIYCLFFCRRKLEFYLLHSRKQKLHKLDTTVGLIAENFVNNHFFLRSEFEKISCDLKNSYLLLTLIITKIPTVSWESHI